VNDLVVAVVPIRSFRQGKSRLAAILSESERADLLRESGNRAVRAALDSRVIDTVLVVSPDDEALSWAETFGPRVQSLAQSQARPGLNEALDAARAWALERDVDRILSLFADLPLLDCREVRRIVSRCQPVVLGPDRRYEGTNVLSLDLRGKGASFQFSFGAGSLQKHLTEAERLELGVAILKLPGVEFDLDVPADLQEYRQLGELVAAGEQRFLALALCGAME
jgi:2-phospho-L-lactate guanylyltransferase